MMYVTTVVEIVSIVSQNPRLRQSYICTTTLISVCKQDISECWAYVWLEKDNKSKGFNQKFEHIEFKCV